MDEKFLNKIVELQNLFDEGVVTTADNIPQPEPRQDVEEIEAVNAFMKRNPMAGGGMLVQPSVDGLRPGYAEARYDDPRSNIKKGDELGIGIQQREYLGKSKLPTYSIYAGQERAKSGKTLEEAITARDALLKQAGGLKPTAVPRKNTWENLTKDPLYKTFFKEQVKVNDNIKKAMKANNLTESSPLKKIFEALRSEVSKAKKGVKSPAGVGTNVLDNLNRTFESTFKTKLKFAGTITSADLVSKLDELGIKTTTQMINQYLRYGNPNYTPKKYPIGSRMYLMENNRIKAGKEFVETLNNLGIKTEVLKGQSQYSKNRPSRVGKGKTTRTNLEGAAGGQNRFTISKPQLNKLATSNFFTENEPVYRMLDDFSSQSRSSDEYKANKYKIDSENIRRLVRNMNNIVADMSDKELRNFVNKNPKLKNLVETRFNPAKGEFESVKLNEITNQVLREKMRFEADHIRGRETVKFDPATKKILDGLDIEYPRNLYIVPNAVNNSTKKLVENYVASFPNETKKIKKIDKFFKDNNLTYWDKINNQYRGATPKITNTDLSHLGLTTNDVLLNKKVNLKTGELVIEEGPGLLKRIEERDKFLKKLTKKDFTNFNNLLNNLAGELNPTCRRKTAADGGRINFEYGSVACQAEAKNYVKESLAKGINPKATDLKSNIVKKIFRSTLNFAKGALDPKELLNIRSQFFSAGALASIPIFDGVIAADAAIRKGKPIQEALKDTLSFSFLAPSQSVLDAQKVLDSTTASPAAKDYAQRILTANELKETQTNVSGEIAPMTQFKKIKDLEQKLKSMEYNRETGLGGEVGKRDFEAELANILDKDTATLKEGLVKPQIPFIGSDKPDQIEARKMKPVIEPSAKRDYFKTLGDKEPSPFLATELPTRMVLDMPPAYDKAQLDLPTEDYIGALSKALGYEKPSPEIAAEMINQEKFRQLFETPGFTGASEKFSKGGIAGLSGGDKSGPPPQRGPNSEGLSSLLKRGTNI